MDVTPLPRIQSILEELRGKTLFSKFDIRAGYNNIRINPDDTYKTGFKTSRGLYEWVVMPFGLCNAPATFSRMGNDVFRPIYSWYPRKFRHYMDDCIIMTGPGEDALHEEIAHMFFDILGKHELFLKPAKCEFFKNEVDYLGIRVKNGELMIDPAKISGITEWPRTLKNIKEVRSTLGLLGYHRQWIPNFAKIAKPLTDLLQKGREFAWNTLCMQAVNRLIGMVISEPVLVPLDTDQQFILYVDASQFATGAILYQADKDRKDKRGNPLLRPLGFNSQTFTKTEQNYPIYDRELLAVMRRLRCWRHLLQNTEHPALVITDHANLQYYREPHKLGPRVNGYVAELADYHFKLIYKPGNVNRADGLSRRPDLVPEIDDEQVIVLPSHLFVDPNAPTTTLTATRTKPEDYDTDDTLIDSESDSEVDSDTDGPILKARATTIDGQEISAYDLDMKILEAQNSDKALLGRWVSAHHLSKQGRYWTKDGVIVVVGNNELKRGVIHLFHDSHTAGHPGIAKTTALVTKYYWWPNIRDFVTQYIKGCATCQMSKINTNPMKPALYPITLEPGALPFQTIALDFITKLPESEGYDSILTITDHDCTKASLFLPCNETIDTPELAKLYATTVFPHYGIPQKIISDRDPRLTSNFAKELCGLLDIHQNISTAYHPQTDGQSERTNQTLEQYLRLYCANRQEDWASWLPIAQYTKNSWPHATTGKTPFDLLIGYTPQAHQPTRTPTLPDIDSRLAAIQEARTAAQEAVRKVQERLTKGVHSFKGYKKEKKYGWKERI
jgi:hypothetical protein